MSSSSLPCYEAFTISSANVGILSLAGLLAITVFITYAKKMHKTPNSRMMQNKFDVDSASWVAVLAILNLGCTQLVNIVNYHCGTECPSVTLTCNSQIGTAVGIFFSAISVTSAAILKLLSYNYRLKHPYSQVSTNQVGE